MTLDLIFSQANDTGAWKKKSKPDLIITVAGDKNVKSTAVFTIVMHYRTIN